MRRPPGLFAMNRCMPGWLALLLALVLSPCAARTQEFEFSAPPRAADPGTPAVMRDLAERMLPVYEEKDTDRYLANVAALQLVAGNAVAAHDSRQNLRDRQRGTSLGQPRPRELLYDIYAKARAIEEHDRIPFAQAFTQAYQDVVPALSDRDAHAVAQWFETPLSVHESLLQRSFDRLRAKGSIQTGEAVELVWAFLAFDAHRSFRPLVKALDSEDDRQRYITEEDVVIRTPRGVDLHALIVRPRTQPAPLPTLLEFTIYLGEGEAKAAAAHGYVGVVAYTRGKKGKTRGRIIPFLHEGEDARAVIQWITRQPWSDGRVGMLGEGYSGFAAWAAAKRRPPALKAIATSSPMAPGIDFPMAGNIHHNAAYRWAYTHAQQLEKPRGSDDDAEWRKRDQNWYQRGRPYRELDRRGKKSDRVFSAWLDHPSYDRYWQKMIPFRQGYAKIDIPVLTTAGYYAGDAGALYYFSEHTRYQPAANHTLLLGPYGEGAAAGSVPVLRGYAVDAAALIDLRALRYQWFDHIFKNAAPPALLKNRVNWQLMGTNEWRHAPSVEAMARESMRFYLEPAADPARGGRLSTTKPAQPSSLQQTVNLKDRRGPPAAPSLDIIGRNLSVPDSLSFTSEPLAQAVEFSGLLSGSLDFEPNKQDVDLHLTAYELLPGGGHIQLFDPYEFRASYAGDRTKRRLLKGGVRQQLAFKVERLTGRRLAAGSRLLIVIGVNKRPDREINYGSGKPVSEESLADARTPLRIRWYGSSYVELPVRK